MNSFLHIQFSVLWGFLMLGSIVAELKRGEEYTEPHNTAIQPLKQKAAVFSVFTANLKLYCKSLNIY